MEKAGRLTAEKYNTDDLVERSKNGNKKPIPNPINVKIRRYRANGETRIGGGPYYNK